VDLANMMLTLALRSDAETVFRIALEEGFSADEVAEAFAATKGVTMPSQLRTELKRDGRDLNEAFRKLAPRREPVAIQRWTVRRLAYVAAMAAGVVVALSMTMQNLQRAGFKP
jgi:hypothetical protein